MDVRIPGKADAAQAVVLVDPNTGAPSAAGLSGTDRSGTAGTTSSVLIPANAARRSFWIKNDSAVDVWLNFGVPAAATPGGGNLKVAAGGYFDNSYYIGDVRIISGGAAVAVSAREF